MPEKKWTELDAAQHRAHAMQLLDGLEVIRREKRLNVARAILYMAQGESFSSSIHLKGQKPEPTFLSVFSVLSTKASKSQPGSQPYQGVHVLYALALYVSAPTSVQTVFN